MTHSFTIIEPEIDHYYRIGYVHDTVSTLSATTLMTKESFGCYRSEETRVENSYKNQPKDVIGFNAEYVSVYVWDIIRDGRVEQIKFDNIGPAIFEEITKEEFMVEVL